MSRRSRNARANKLEKFFYGKSEAQAKADAEATAKREAANAKRRAARAAKKAAATQA